MKICNICGVELDDALLVCPLCGSDPLNHKEHEQSISNTPEEIIELHRREQAAHLWELTGIIAFSAICVCTIVDLIVGPGLRWSLFVDTSCLALWICHLLVHFKKVSITARIIGFAITIILTLFLFSLFSINSGWFIPLALPICISLYFCTGLVILFRKAFRFYGFNLLGITFASIAIFCILTECILDLHNNGTIQIHWSVIAAISIFPLSLFFFFMHYRLKSGNRLDSFFHV
jgi:hypothetical protein